MLHARFILFFNITDYVIKILNKKLNRLQVETALKKEQIRITNLNNKYMDR